MGGPHGPAWPPEVDDGGAFQPLLAERRRRKREELNHATEAGFERVAREAARRTRKPLPAINIAEKVTRVKAHFKVGKHFDPDINEGSHSSMKFPHPASAARARRNDTSSVASHSGDSACAAAKPPLTIQIDAQRGADRSGEER